MVMLHPLTLQIIDCDITPTTPAMCTKSVVNNYNYALFYGSSFPLYSLCFLNANVDKGYACAYDKAKANIINNCNTVFVPSNNTCSLLCQSNGYGDIKNLPCDSKWLQGVDPLLPGDTAQFLAQEIRHNITLLDAYDYAKTTRGDKCCYFSGLEICPKKPLLALLKLLITVMTCIRLKKWKWFKIQVQPAR